MYLVGQGQDIDGPGTSLVQRINWSRANEQQIMDGYLGRGLGDTSVPEFDNSRRQMTRYRGIGCAGACHARGMGCGCKAGLGLFDSGMDVSTWGWPEWAVVIVGGYMVVSTVFTTKRAARGIAAIPGERRKKKAAYYRKKAAELTRRKAA